MIVEKVAKVVVVDVELGEVVVLSKKDQPQILKWGRGEN